MGICYIVGAGDFYHPFTPKRDDLVIAADGGSDTLVREGIRCDLLIGDLDSIGEVPSGVELLRHPVKKDETDMHLGYLEGARRGYESFRIYGGTGGREDHTIANISLLLYIRKSGGRATLIGEKNESFVIDCESVEVSGECGKHLSLFALFGTARGVYIEGLEYSAENLTLTPEFPLAVSNRFIGECGKITVKDGTLLVMREF